MIHAVEGAKIITSDNGDPEEVHMTMKLSVFLSLRDMHLKLKKSWVDGKLTYLTRSLNDPEIQSPKGVIRMDLF